MATLRYRYAAEADVPAVVALVESAYRGEESLAGWTSEAELIGGQRTDAAAVSELIATPRCHILLACEGPALQASCELREPGGRMAVSQPTCNFGHEEFEAQERPPRDHVLSHECVSRAHANPAADRLDDAIAQDEPRGQRC